MKIGILGAMPQEIEIVCQQLSSVTIKTHGNRQYYCGKIKTIDVVMVFSRCGKVAAATTATALITEFDVTHLIFTGVAGAVSAELAIGDVVISKQLYQHDIDARPLFPRYEIPLMKTTNFEADPLLIEKVQVAVQKMFQHPEAVVSRNALKEFGIHTPKMIIGTITSGDQFITSVEKTREISEYRPDTLAVEMEGAAVAQVCVDYAIPFVVIRTISDLANHQSSIDFPKFIDHVAKHYAETIIRYVFAHW